MKLNTTELCFMTPNCKKKNSKIQPDVEIGFGKPCVSVEVFMFVLCVCVLHFLLCVIHLKLGLFAGCVGMP